MAWAGCGSMVLGCVLWSDLQGKLKELRMSGLGKRMLETTAPGGSEGSGMPF